MNLMTEDAVTKSPAKGAVQVYCFATMVAEEARQAGCVGFAKDIEGAIAGLIAGLPKAEQREALRLSYDLAMAAVGGEPAQPRLRLVYSRD